MDELRNLYNPALAKARLAGENRSVPREVRTAMQFREWEEHPYLGVVVPKNRTDKYPTIPVSWAELPDFVKQIARRNGIYGYILSSPNMLSDAEIARIQDLYYGKMHD